jgi:uncharacterized membrane protein
MTAFSSILGVVPLVAATGAGASSRQSIGMTLFGGLLVGTVLGLVIIPILYVVVQTLREKVKARLLSSSALEGSSPRLRKRSEVAARSRHPSSPQ